jgi:hypothetical protein
MAIVGNQEENEEELIIARYNENFCEVSKVKIEKILWK